MTTTFQPTWALVALATLCLPSLVGAAAPLRYFIGKEVVQVHVSSTTKKTRAIQTLKGADRNKCLSRHSGSPDPELCLTETLVTNREGTVATRLVADPKLSADISVAGRALTDDSTTVELREGMLLQSINTQSTGRAGDLIVSIAKFAGVLAGAPGLLAVEGGPTPSINRVSSCDPFARPLADQPDIVRLWLWENQTQCDRWQEIRKRQKARDALLDDRSGIEHAIRGASGAELKLLLAKLLPIEEAIKKAETDLKTRQDGFNTQLEAFTTSLKLGTTSSLHSYDQVLDLSDLPAPTGLSAGLAESTAQQVVDTTFKAAAKELWAQSRMIVTLDPIAPATCSPAPTVPGNGAATDKSVVNVYFRQGAPARMRAFTADQTLDASKSTLRVVGDRFDNFVHSCLPVSMMTFSRSIWSSRELSLTFDERGRPVKLVRTSKSDAAAIAASLASGATAFRDELAATVAKVVDVQANRRKIEMDDLTRRLEQAKGEKDLLDAQLALDATSSNFDAALKQKQAAATLDALKAELALATAQAAAEQTQQIEALKSAVALINQQLELIKAQQALDKAGR